MNPNNSDQQWIELVKKELDSGELTLKKEAYLKRIVRLHQMPDLSKLEGNPVEMMLSRVVNSQYYKDFTHIEIPEVVAEYETFDMFNFPADHVVRRTSDSYFVQKSGKTHESMLLRPHTSVMWYHYLIRAGGLSILEREGEVRVLSSGKVYRVDELDTTHHECFHQIDGLKITRKDKEHITQDTLKNVLKETIYSLFGEEVSYKFHEDSFPYTLESLEVEVEYQGKNIEVLGAGIVHPNVLRILGVDPDLYSGWAFGFGIERLAMILKQVPDIRIFWSEDPRIIQQWGDFHPYKEVSSFPPVFKDISLIVPKEQFQQDINETEKKGEVELQNEADSFSIAGVVRDIAEGLVEQVKIIDIYENDTIFGENNKSVTLRIVFRSLERSLTHGEINILYYEIRSQIETQLGYTLR